MRVSPRASAALRAGRPRSRGANALPRKPVIPAKAGIQRATAKLAIRNQARIAAGGSLLPLREKARMRVSPRASAALRAGRPRSQGREHCPYSRSSPYFRLIALAVLIKSGSSWANSSHRLLVCLVTFTSPLLGLSGSQATKFPILMLTADGFLTMTRASPVTSGWFGESVRLPCLKYRSSVSISLSRLHPEPGSMFMFPRRGLSARDTLTLALSRKGRGDSLASIHAWLRAAGLVGQPAAPLTRTA